ncbi:hypothetical protein PENTCL1PPCAC_2904, partial [Pristionchus entomophagus]
VFHRNFLVLHSHTGGAAHCLYRETSFLTPFTDHVLSLAASVVNMIALGVAIIACLRADEFLIPAQVLLLVSIEVSLSLTLTQAFEGYYHNCACSLSFSFFINVLTCAAYVILP